MGQFIGGAAYFRRRQRRMWHFTATLMGQLIQQSTTYFPVGREEVMVLCLIKHVGDRKGCLLAAYYVILWRMIQQSTPPKHNNRQYCCSKREREFPTTNLAQKFNKGSIEPCMQEGYGEQTCYAPISNLDPCFHHVFQLK